MDEPVYNEIKQDEPINLEVPEVATGGTMLSSNGTPIPGSPTVTPRKFSSSGVNVQTVAGNNIQDAIDSMNRAGGGKVYLQAGTYIVTRPLIGYSGVDIEGENQSTTIIDFNSTSANLSFTGTDVYTTGTITSITSGVNVTGSGTSWLTNVTTDHQIFIGNTWYKIAVVLTDTTLTLAEGYQGNATLPGATYRASKIQRDVDIKDVTLKNSTGTALVATDCRNFSMKNVKFDTNNKGFVFTNVSEFIGDNGLLSVSNTSNGAELTNARLCNFHSLATPGNGGHGFVLNNVETGVVMESSSNSNTGDGYNLTSCSTIVMTPVEASANGGQGIELVSGNDNISINGIMNANTSDGIKFTATSDNCKIGECKITSNGGYGVNVAASTCDNNIISTSFFSNNSSGNKNDSGTGTLWMANIPTSINDAVASSGATLSASATQVSFSNTTTEQTLATFTLAANTLGTAGAVRVFVPIGDYRAVDNLTFKIYIGTTSVSTVLAGASNNNIWSGFVEGWIMAAGATNSQRLTIHSQVQKIETLKVGQPEIGHTYATGTAAEDTTGALTVKLTATFGGPNASDIFRSDGYSAKN